MSNYLHAAIAKKKYMPVYIYIIGYHSDDYIRYLYLIILYLGKSIMPSTEFIQDIKDNHRITTEGSSYVIC